ncbi:MAG: hypothetical protein KDD29_02060 [Flavobacteriales bacterium]|nr:hypothetical protein [Flavobacteriales bacterium]MCB9334841.1 hypothetical protein [Flavobacteriales bacterium]
MKKLLYILIALFSILNTNAQTYSVEATPDTNSILIGEQINIILKANYRVDEGEVNIIFPTLYDTINEFVEIVSKSVVDTIIPDKNDPYAFVKQQKITITSFDSGYYAIPPFKFIINADTVETEPILIEVQTMEVDTTKAIFDIKQPISEPFSIVDWLKDNWWWMIAILVLGIGIFFLIKYLKNRKPKEEPEVIIPDIPIHIIALEKLEKVKSDKLWQSGKVKAYHSHISEILREYIENRYQVNALEETTSEIMHGLRLQNISPVLMNKLTQTLTLADLVKFAKEQPLANENEMSINNAIEFVNATKIENIEAAKDAN